MIDINIVKANAKYYSVKCELTFSNDSKEEVTARIIALDLVNPTGGTSFTKLKTLFHSESHKDNLSRVKYPYVYDAITKKLIQKYRMKVLNI